MLKRKGQGAFEYLLLIGGVLFLAVAVIMILRGHVLGVGQSTIKQGTEAYQGALWSFELDAGGAACADGTASGKCNALLQYCKRGQLIANCSDTSKRCNVENNGCPTSTECNTTSGTCSQPTSPLPNLFHPQCTYYEPIWNGSACVCNSSSCGTGGCTAGSCTQKCSDGTPLGLCKINAQPQYCNGAALVNNCSKCGCLKGTCGSSGECGVSCGSFSPGKCTNDNKFCLDGNFITCSNKETCANDVGCICTGGCKSSTIYCNTTYNPYQWRNCSDDFGSEKYTVCSVGHCCNETHNLWDGTTCVQCMSGNNNNCVGRGCNTTSWECCPDAAPLWDGTQCISSTCESCYDNHNCEHDKDGTTICHGNSVCTTIENNMNLVETCGKCGVANQCMGSGYCDSTGELTACGQGQSCDDSTGCYTPPCTDNGVSIPAGQCHPDRNGHYCTTTGTLETDYWGCDKSKMYLDERWWDVTDLIKYDWTFESGNSGWGTPVVNNNKLTFTMPNSNNPDEIKHAYYVTPIEVVVTGDNPNLKVILDVTTDLDINEEYDFGVCFINESGTRYCHGIQRVNCPCDPGVSCFDWKKGIYNIDIQVAGVNSFYERKASGECPGDVGDDIYYPVRIVNVEFIVMKKTYNTDKSISVNQFYLLSPMGSAPIKIQITGTVVVDSITENSAKIKWTTDKASNSSVKYWKEESPGSIEVTPPNKELVPDHSITLTDLESNKKYSFEVVSCASVDDCVVSQTTYDFTTPPTFVRLWSIGGEGQGIVINSPGNIIYVCDFGGKKLRRFDTDGNPLNPPYWEGSTETGQFKGPIGVAVDSKGYVYVSDFYMDTTTNPSTPKGRVIKFNQGGEYITTWESADGTAISSPRGLAVTDDYLLYVVDKGSNRIIKFNLDGSYNKIFSVDNTDYCPKSDGYEASGIAVNQNGIYVSCWKNNCVSCGRIIKFNADGNGYTRWDTTSVGEEMGLIYFIANDSLGNLYVPVYGHDKILKLNSEGKVVTKWGTNGVGEKQFIRPTGIALDSEYIYISDSENTRIQKYRYT